MKMMNIKMMMTMRIYLKEITQFDLFRETLQWLTGPSWTCNGSERGEGVIPVPVEKNRPKRRQIEDKQYIICHAEFSRLWLHTER